MSSATGIRRDDGQGLELTARMLREHRDERMLEEEQRIMAGRLVDEEADTYFRAVMRGEHGTGKFDFNLTHADKRAVMEQRDLSKLTAGAGGNLVASDFVRVLFENIVETSGVRRAGASVFTTETGQNLGIPRGTGTTAASIVTEGAAIPESDPVFGQLVLGAYKYGLLIQVSNELLADSAVDVAGYIARQAGRAIGLGSGAHFVTGTGTAQPEGVMTNITSGVTAAAPAATLDLNAILTLYGSVASGYAERGSWLMHPATKIKLLQAREGAALQFIYQPGLAGSPDTLLGRPIVTDPTAAQLGVNNKVIAFGDFGSGYAIRDVVGVRFEEGPGSTFGNDLQNFRVLLRTDGKPADAAALRCYTCAAS